MKHGPNNKDVVEIEEKGSYFEIDQEGFVVNPTSIDKVQDKWKPAIEDVVSAYKKHYGEYLRSVYVRGSAAKGEAIEGISDLDSFAFVDLDEKDIEKEWFKEAERSLRDKYFFIKGIEFGADPLVIEGNGIILLNQSLLVYGEPVDFPRLKPGPQMAIHAKKFDKRIKWFRDKLEKEKDPEDLAKGCVWVMKLLLRMGFEMTMERSKMYTRDLYRCYETFSEYYPEKEKEMKEVLYLALNPTADKKVVLSIIDNLGVWMSEEKKKYFS